MFAAIYDKIFGETTEDSEGKNPRKSEISDDWIIVEKVDTSAKDEQEDSLDSVKMDKVKETEEKNNLKVAAQKRKKKKTVIEKNVVKTPSNSRSIKSEDVFGKTVVKQKKSISKKDDKYSDRSLSRGTLRRRNKCEVNVGKQKSFDRSKFRMQIPNKIFQTHCDCSN